MSFFSSFIINSLPSIKVSNNKFWALHHRRYWVIGFSIFLASTLFMLMSLLSSLSQISPSNIALANDSVIDPLCETNFLISPDSNWMVYYARPETSQVYQLYSRPLDGSSDPIKLNSDIVNGNGLPVFCIFYARISPDSQWVVYLADQDIDGVNELYRRAIDGSDSPIKLNGPMVDGGSVASFADAFQISPDSQWVVYEADQDTDGLLELYSRRLDGSDSPVKLNGPLPNNDGFVGGFQITSDSSRVIYKANQLPSGEVGLYSRPIDGSGTPLKLNAPLVSGGSVGYYQISQDRMWFVYTAEQDTAGTSELYSRLLDGSSPVTKINDTLINGGDVMGFKISPDNKWIVYIADQDKNGVSEVYSRPIDGSGNAVKLNGLITGGAISSIYYGFYISPDSRWVVYWGDPDQAGVYSLYSRRIDGSGQPTKLDDVPLGSNNGAWEKYQISPDSSQVAYLGYHYYYDNFGSYRVHSDLYVRPIDGSTGSIKLNEPLVPRGSRVHQLMITPDGNQVLYLADQDTDRMFEIYSRPINGSETSRKLSHTLSGDSRIWEMQITPNGQWLVYLASDGLSAGSLPSASVNDTSHLFSRIDNTYMLGRTNLSVVSDYNYSLFLPLLLKNH